MSVRNRLWIGAIVSQLFLLFYLEVVEWVNLYPWNDIRRGNGQEMLDIILGLVMVAAIIATYRRWRPGMIGAALLYTVWLGLQITTFWVAYAQGASPMWARIYAANFAQTIQWLPRSGMHLPPDANHIVLQLVVVVALIFTAAAAWYGPVKQPGEVFPV